MRSGLRSLIGMLMILSVLFIVILRLRVFGPILVFRVVLFRCR